MSLCLVIAIPRSRKPVYRDPARFCNTEIPVLRRLNNEIFGTGVVYQKGHYAQSEAVRFWAAFKNSIITLMYKGL
jgi:hypothetical protein